MFISRRQAMTASAAMPFAALISPVYGQTTPPGATTRTPPTDAATNEDHLLAACLLITGYKQIEVCKFAQTKLQSDDAKSFAKAEIEEQEGIKATLQKLGYDYPVVAIAGGRQPGVGQQSEPSQPGIGQPGRPIQPGQPDQPARQNYMVRSGKKTLAADAVALLVINHQVAEQCIANFRRELERYTGIKADKRFIGNQLDEHLSFKDHVEIYRRHSSRDMQQQLETALKVIDSHISTCRHVMDKLDSMREKEGDK